MREYKEILAEFKNIAENPREQLDKLLADGKQVVGSLTYFCPEELVYAADMVPFGIWGADIEVSEARRWFPAFICSILQSALEMGISGRLNGLTAIMIPKLCDSLKCMGANWECAVPEIPLINVAHAQNRKMEAGITFTASQYRKIILELEKLGGKAASDSDISSAIELLNKRRSAMRIFVHLACEHPEAISPKERNDVIKSSYFMEAGPYLSMLNELNDILNVLPDSKWNGIRVVTTGVLADSPQLLQILEDNNITIAGDQILQESVSFRENVPGSGDPVSALAKRMAHIEGTSVLFDPGKRRASELVEIVRKTSAQAVIYVLTKFCDPDEYDYVPVKKLLDENKIPLLLVEVDRQDTGLEQARTAIEAFSSMILK